MRLSVLFVLFAAAASSRELCFTVARSEQLAIYNPSQKPAIVHVRGASRRGPIEIGPFETALIPNRARKEMCPRLRTDDGVLAAVPGLGEPEASSERIWTTHARTAAAFEARTRISRIALKIGEGSEENARVVDSATIQVNLALADRLRSRDELAFAVAHEFGHVFQRRAKMFRYRENPELDADAWAVRIMKDAGYQPAAGIAALTKLRANIETGSRIPQSLQNLFDQRGKGIAEAIRISETEPPLHEPGQSFLTGAVRALGHTIAAARDRFRVAGSRSGPGCQCGN